MAKRVPCKLPDTAQYEDILIEAKRMGFPVTMFLVGSDQTVSGRVMSIGSYVWLKHAMDDTDIDTVTYLGKVSSIITSSPKGAMRDLDQ